jgi:hypothetical protein
MADTGVSPTNAAAFAGPESRRKESREEVEEGGEISRVRIYDLAKELKPEHKKILKVARLLWRSPHGFGAGGELDMTDSPDNRKPDKPDKDKPKPRRPGGQDNH